MIKWLFCLYVGLQCGEVFANNLNEGLVAYWNFDESGYAGNKGNSNLYRRGEAQPEVGKRGMGIHLKGDSDYLELNNGFPLSTNFSIAFWFKPDNPNAFQTLMHQFQELNSTYETLYKIEMSEQSVSFVYGPNYEFEIQLPENIILSNDWLFLSVVKSGGHLKLSLGTKWGNFSQSKLFPYNIASANYAQALFGMGDYRNSAFTGGLDEIMIYDKAIHPITLEKLQKGDNPAALILGGVEDIEGEVEEAETINSTIEAPVVQLSASVPISFRNLVNRRPYLQDSTSTPYHKFILELWDYDHFDHDTIAIYLNGKILADNVLVPPQKSARLIEFNLESNKDNYLSFVAMNKGLGGGNTTEIRVWNDQKTILKHKLIITPKTNAIMKIKHEGKDTRELKLLKNIEVEHEDLTLELWDKSREDLDFVTVYCNGDTLLNYHEIRKERTRVNLNLYKNHLNTLVFVAEDAGNVGNNTARVRLYRGEKLLDEFTVTSTYRKNSLVQITVVDPVQGINRNLRKKKHK